MQAKLKGIIMRNRLRIVRSSNRQNIGKDTSNYTYTATTKITDEQLTELFQKYKKINGWSDCSNSSTSRI